MRLRTLERRIFNTACARCAALDGTWCTPPAAGALAAVVADPEVVASADVAEVAAIAAAPAAVSVTLRFGLIFLDCIIGSPEGRAVVGGGGRPDAECAPGAASDCPACGSPCAAGGDCLSTEAECGFVVPLSLIS